MLHLEFADFLYINGSASKITIKASKSLQEATKISGEHKLFDLKFTSHFYYVNYNHAVSLSYTINAATNYCSIYNEKISLSTQTFGWNEFKDPSLGVACA